MTKQIWMPNGFTRQETKDLHQALVRCHVSKALSGERMPKIQREEDIAFIRQTLVLAACFIREVISGQEESK
ncbi:hypothetical protein NMD70_09805 [Edwardsiella tarda]|uniref:hypothetical protein n=1 Tax=Edwardsiella tarda TaxID=636 RepID=UPI00351C1AF9